MALTYKHQIYAIQVSTFFILEPNVYRCRLHYKDVNKQLQYQGCQVRLSKPAKCPEKLSFILCNRLTKNMYLCVVYLLD